MRLDAPLDDIFRSPSNVRVLRALHQLPAGLSASAREIARRAGVSHPTASKALASLAEQGVVARTRAPRASAFELRRTHTAVERLTSLFEWEERLRRELIDLLRTEILGRARSSVTAAYLFGSAAKGDMTATSDLDIAVLHTACTTESVTAALQEIGETIQRRFGNRLSFILADRPLEELQESRREGFRLSRRILREGIPILDSQARPVNG
jgi:predicted nucleotidyltransferase